MVRGLGISQVRRFVTGGAALVLCALLSTSLARAAPVEAPAATNKTSPKQQPGGAKSAAAKPSAPKPAKTSAAKVAKPPVAKAAKPQVSKVRRPNLRQLRRTERGKACSMPLTTASIAPAMSAKGADALPAAEHKASSFRAFVESIWPSRRPGA